jgi:hypothetical protein
MPKAPELTKEDVFALYLDRPHKFSAEQVNYRPAPAGSVMRCAGCANLFRRATDNFSVCQLFRSEETDDEGVQPHWTCDWFTVDGLVFPRLPDEALAVPSVSDSEEETQEHT